MKKRVATPKEVSKIKVRAKAAYWLGDPSLVPVNQTAKEAKRAIENPEFVNVKVKETWTEWRNRDVTRGNNGGFTVSWEAKDVGFGEIVFILDKKNKLHIHSECMSRRFVKKVLVALVDKAVLDE